MSSSWRDWRRAHGATRHRTQAGATESGEAKYFIALSNWLIRTGDAATELKIVVQINPLVGADEVRRFAAIDRRSAIARHEPADIPQIHVAIHVEITVAVVETRVERLRASGF